MHLIKEMKELMAFLYSREGITRYEFSFDKRDNCFYARIFINEYTYITIFFLEDKCKVDEWSVSKNFYHPSKRVGFLSQYLKAYRQGQSAYPTIQQLLCALDKLDTSKGFTIPDRDSYSPWRGPRRATVRF